jgi:hypothetical protein
MLHLALFALAGSLHGNTLTLKEIVDDNQYWQPCLINTVLVDPSETICDMSWPPFWQAKLILASQRCNCATTPLHVEMNLAAGTEAKFSVKRAFCGTEIQFDLSSKLELAIVERYEVPPCRCSGYIFWRQMAVSAVTETQEEWVCVPGSGFAGTGAPGGYPTRVPVRRFRLQSLTPMLTPPDRTEYALQAPCAVCPGTPAPPPDQDGVLTPPAHILALAGTANDWYTKLDCQEFFKPVGLTSPFDLSLYELRGLAHKVATELALHPGGTIELILSDKVSFKGNTAAVAHDLRRMALMLIDSKGFGDFDEDGERNAADFAILSAAMIDPPWSNVRLIHRLDMNGDGSIDEQDATVWASLQP